MWFCIIQTSALSVVRGQCALGVRFLPALQFSASRSLLLSHHKTCDWGARELLADFALHAVIVLADKQVTSGARNDAMAASGEPAT